MPTVTPSVLAAATSTRRAGGPVDGVAQHARRSPPRTASSSAAAATWRRSVGARCAASAREMREWRTRRPVCSLCLETDRTPCARCGLEAAAPTMGPRPCAPGVARRPRRRARDVACRPSDEPQREPRCFDCYQRARRTVRAMRTRQGGGRFARDGEPDLCGVCWQGPVMACEGCGRTRALPGRAQGADALHGLSAGEAQPCAHCGQPRRPTAHWHEGPVCQTCYDRPSPPRAHARPAVDQRRLLVSPGLRRPVCASCAGEPPTHVCERCGIEDCLYERGLCPRCVVNRRLTVILGTKGCGTGTVSIPSSTPSPAPPLPGRSWIGSSRRRRRSRFSRIGRGERTPDLRDD